MASNEEIVRELYACAEGGRHDMERLVSLFADEGYLYNVSDGKRYYGKEIGDLVGSFKPAFPDVHRELFSFYVTGDVVVVELAIRGTHTGALAFPGGSLAPTGKAIDVPCCDVFHVENGKVASFHCYTMVSIMQQQLGAASS
jgi:ketosteroid isomerase-like protein